ncbi:enoyl-CoA hydratase/isomerase family protein [soil metagenome]
MLDDTPALRHHDVGHVRVITLARPERRNPLGDATISELREALRGAEGNARVRVLVLAADGPAFCAGLDLRDLATAADGPMEHHQASASALGDLFAALVGSRLPIVAAVQGPAVGGGVGLVLAADVAVMAAGATLRFSEVRLGFVPALVAVLLVRHAGEKATRDLLLRAAPLSATDAARLGLVNEVSADGDALARALVLAAEIAENAPAAVAATKRLLISLRSLALEHGLRSAADVNAAARATSTLREGLAAFQERREPEWGDV